MAAVLGTRACSWQAFVAVRVLWAGVAGVLWAFLKSFSVLFLWSCLCTLLASSLLQGSGRGVVGVLVVLMPLHTIPPPDLDPYRPGAMCRCHRCPKRNSTPTQLSMTHDLA